MSDTLSHKKKGTVNIFEYLGVSTDACLPDNRGTPRASHPPCAVPIDLAFGFQLHHARADRVSRNAGAMREFNTRQPLRPEQEMPDNRGLQCFEPLRVKLFCRLVARDRIAIPRSCFQEFPHHAPHFPCLINHFLVDI